MSSTRGIRIGELAQRAGVPVSTVKHYLREELLPPPIVKHRNSAYYNEDSVERVRVVRELQEKTFLPLKELRKIAARFDTPAELRRYFDVSGLADRLKQAGWVARDRFLDDGAFKAEELDRLERLAIIARVEQNGQGGYGTDDAALLSTLQRLRGLGLTAERGFRAEQLQAFRETLERLARQEVAAALQGLIGNMPPGELGSVAQEVFTLANDLVSALHRKVVRQVLDELRGGAHA